MCLKDGVGKQGVLFVIFAEIHERFVHHKLHAACATPTCEVQHLIACQEVARRIVGIDEEEGIHGVCREIRLEVFCRIVEVGILGGEDFQTIGIATVGILFKSGVRNP